MYLSYYCQCGLLFKLYVTITSY